VFLWLLAGLTLPLVASPTFADDAPAASSTAPSGADSGGGSSASAASSTTSSDSNGTTAAAAVTNNSTSTVDQGGGTANADTTTTGAAASSQSTGGVPPPSPPPPAPTVHEVVTTPLPSDTDAPPSPELAAPAVDQQVQAQTELDTPAPPTPVITTGQGTAAGAASQVTAEAHNDGDTPVATASASSQAGAIAVQVTTAAPTPSIASVETNVVPPSGDIAGVAAVAVSSSNADAFAKGGDAPMAYTSAGSGTYAAAVGGENRSVVAEVAAPDAIHQSLINDNESWAIAYVAGGQYSIAVATQDSATAYSSTYGAGTAFTSDDVWAAALSWATAYATANKLTATAWATAGASASAGTSGGASVAVSASAGRAQIRLELVSHSSSGSSSTASVECTIRVIDWQLLKRVKPEQRARYLSCECPPGWRNPVGAGRFSCVRANEIETSAPVYVVSGKSKVTTAVAAVSAKPIVAGKGKPAVVVASKSKGKPVLVAGNVKPKGKPVVATGGGKSKNKPIQVASSAKGKNKSVGFVGFLRAIFSAKPA
jgi:hypothetical protein